MGNTDASVAASAPDQAFTPELPPSHRSAAIEDLLRLAETDPLGAAERIMAHLRSPAGCPWDREQTFDSIRRHTLEEVYEVFDAIERRDWSALRDELGDLLLQLLFYTQMAHEENRFALVDVARSLNAKLIRRHPHIFADTEVASSAEVKQNWDAIKRAERQSPTGKDEPQPASLLGDVPRSMPALMEARKLGSAAASVNFDWPETAGVFAKVGEELEELRSACVLGEGSAAAEEELGDLLFTVVNLSRRLHVDPEMALRAANAKFRARFAAMEFSAAKRGRSLALQSPEELEALWAEAKRSTQRNEVRRP